MSKRRDTIIVGESLADVEEGAKIYECVLFTLRILARRKLKGRL